MENQLTEASVLALSCEIQRGGRADAAALADFAALTFAETFGPDNRPEDIEAHLASMFGVRQQEDELVNADVVTVVAKACDALVAYAQFTANCAL